MSVSQSLVHYVNTDELALAQKLYLPYAKKGKKSFSIRDPHVEKFAPLLAATSAQFINHELISQLTELQANSESDDYYRNEFLNIAKNQFSKEPRRVDDKIVMDELKKLTDLRPQEFGGVLDQVSEKFDQRSQKAHDALELLKKTLASNKSKPEHVFTDALRILEGIYRGDHTLEPEYFFTMERVRQQVKKVEKAYRKFIKEKDNGREVLNQADIKEVIEKLEEFVMSERENFRGCVNQIQTDFLAFCSKNKEINQVKDSILSLVNHSRAEFKEEIKVKVCEVMEAYRGNNPAELIDSVKRAINETVLECYRQKTQRDFPWLFKTENVTVVDALRGKGILSGKMIEFLSVYLNADSLAKANAYHEQYCNGDLSQDSETAKTYHLEVDSSNSNIVYLTIRTQYFSTQVDGKYFGSEVARIETVLRIQAGEAVTVLIEKSETHIYDDELRQRFLLNHLKKKGGIADKSSKGQLLEANDLLIVDNFLSSRPWSSQWSKQLEILAATEDLDELYWRARRDSSFFMQFFQLERTPRENPSDQHLAVMQKFCQMPSVLSRLKALESHYEPSKTDLSGALSGIARLKIYLELVKKQEWSQIAEYLKSSEDRGLMLCALNSLKDVRAIKKALSFSGILYALDANTLNYFALKDQSIARVVLRQSFIHRLWIRFQAAIWGEVYWQVPVLRLQGVHIRQLWQVYFKPLKNLIQNLLGKLDLKRDIFKLTTEPLVELRQATSEAIFSEPVLAKQVLKNPLTTVEAANARLSLLSDLGRDLSYEHQSLSSWSDCFQFGLAEPAAGAEGHYCIADDKTVEDHYYKYFQALIKPTKKKKNNNEFSALQEAIAKLWAGKMKLPHRKGIDVIVKKAMIRVIRDKKVPLLFDGVNIEFYKTVLKDPTILRQFIENSKSIEALKKNKAQREVLRTLLRKLMLENPMSFKLEHRYVVNSLFNVEQNEIYDFPDLCRETLRTVLNHYTNKRLMSGFPIDEVDEDKVSKLLQHADPMDLAELLLQYSDITKEIELKEEIKEKEEKIATKRAEIKRLNDQGKTNRSINVPFDAKALKTKIKALEAEMQKLDDELKIPRNTLAFFYHARNLILSNKTGLLDNLPLEYREIFSTGAAVLPDNLPEAFRDRKIRDAVWSDPAQQNQLSPQLSLQETLLFLRSTNFHAIPKLNFSFSSWGQTLLQLWEQPNEGLLQQHWTYLLENVPNFAAWALYQVTHRQGFVLDAEKIKDLSRHKIVGADLLALLEAEHHSEVYVFRTLLLDNPELLSRALRNQRGAHESKTSANCMVRVLAREIQLYRADHNPSTLRIIESLVTENQLSFVVNNADAALLKQWLDSLNISRDSQPLPNGFRKTVVQTLLKTYLISEPRREEMKKSPDLVAVLLAHSTNDELFELTSVDPSCFEIMMQNEDLMKRYEGSRAGAIEQLYIYLEKNLKRRSSFYLPKVIANLKAEVSPVLLVQLLPLLINHISWLSQHLAGDRDLSAQNQRDQVFNLLKSTEISFKLRNADPKALFELFTQAKDLRAIRLIFIQHPILKAHLGLQCWLNLPASQLVGMLRHQFEVSETPGIRNNLGDAMVKVLVDHSDSTALQLQFLALAGDETFMQEIFQRMTLSQLTKLMASNKKIAEVILAHFNKIEHRQGLIALLKRGGQGAGRSQLSELHALLSSQPGLTRVFTDCVKADYAQLNTNSFDAVVMDFIRSDQDHETVFKILDLCYKEERGVFFRNFSVPLNSSKARIFMLYHLSGGLAMSELFNKNIRFLRQFWKAFKHHCFDADKQPRDYLTELEAKDKAGPWLSFNQLVQDKNRKTNADQNHSHTEEVLYLLYEFSRCLRSHYRDFIKTELSEAQAVKTNTPLYRLFKSVIEAESRVLKPVENTCTPKELVSIADADEYLKEGSLPLQNWLFEEHEHQPLTAMMSDADAFCSLLESAVFKQAFARNALLYSKIKEFYQRFKTAFVQSIDSHEEKDNTCYQPENDNGMCTVDELRTVLTAREYFDVGRILHHDEGLLLRDLSGARALFSYANGEFRIAGHDHQIQTYNQLMPIKYLSRYFYARFLHKQDDFMSRIQRDSKYCAAFCQCFKFEWTTVKPAPHLQLTQLATKYDPDKDSYDEDRYPAVTLSLSGLPPETDLLVMYCYAASLNNSDRNHVRALAAMAQDHVEKRIVNKKPVLYFKNGGHPVPLQCLRFLAGNTALLTQNAELIATQRSKLMSEDGNFRRKGSSLSEVSEISHIEDDKQLL